MISTYHNLVLSVKEIHRIAIREWVKAGVDANPERGTNPGYNLEETKPSNFSKTVEVHSHTPPLHPLPPPFSRPVVALRGEAM
jgi:hypothetical protein